MPAVVGDEAGSTLLVCVCHAEAPGTAGEARGFCGMRECTGYVSIRFVFNGNGLQRKCARDRAISVVRYPLSVEQE
jgi:hypothetical protein